MLLVSRRPELYRHARDFHHECGAYQLRAVLNAFGKDAPPEELYYSPWQRERDWSLPWLMPHILARYGIKASWRFWPRSRFRQYALKVLARDLPVLFVINSIVKPGGGLHWVSAWGYDEATNEFLCYDSKAPARTAVQSGGPETRDASGVAGNVRYAASALLENLPWRGTFALIIEGETY